VDNFQCSAAAAVSRTKKGGTDMDGNINSDELHTYLENKKQEKDSEVLLK
jgi:hypothetical protein